MSSVLIFVRNTFVFFVSDAACFVLGVDVFYSGVDALRRCWTERFFFAFCWEMQKSRRPTISWLFFIFVARFEPSCTPIQSWCPVALVLWCDSAHRIRQFGQRSRGCRGFRWGFSRTLVFFRAVFLSGRRRSFVFVCCARVFLPMFKWCCTPAQRTRTCLLFGCIYLVIIRMSFFFFRSNFLRPRFSFDWFVSLHGADTTIVLYDIYSSVSLRCRCKRKCQWRFCTRTAWQAVQTTFERSWTPHHSCSRTLRRQPMLECRHRSWRHFW